ncbi:GNAT family N-acetyltransferase [Pontibaca methylaminivorans]|uniref:Protein N-acetyltransferase, RimJ/RimL family n=1 Tax=Pontibaca methylaminivorans TaxID=515897 RepID=A0A1R3WQL3_9RHOB|nr:GNAT family protein [Pontibaca methylaminivorans]SIT80199.1 Protein N-acetyltransferase, RimJ/RimL family [Pontibaca methylaminivorans]
MIGARAYDPAARLPDWRPPPRPAHGVLEGAHVRLEPLSAGAHAGALFRAWRGHDNLWTYMGYGPFATEEDYRGWTEAMSSRDDPLFFALRIVGGDEDGGGGGAIAGIASYLRIKPEAGSIEIGHLCFAPPLQRTPAATEALSMMMREAFAAGYRRCEWKCDALNIASRRAAQRLGFSHEGVFRQAMVVKGRNRDTAWFSVIDSEWPALAAAHRHWLDPANFDRGRQREALSGLTAPLLAARDPALS